MIIQWIYFCEMYSAADPQKIHVVQAGKDIV